MARPGNSKSHISTTFREEQHMKTLSLKHLLVCGAALLVMILFSACAGVGSTQQSLSGSVVSVNPSTHTVVLSVNGQRDTITNVPDSIIQALSGHVGQTYGIQVTTNSDGTFSVVGGTNVTPEASDGTPEANDTPTSNETPTAVEQGSIEFFGNIIASSNTSVTVSMPDGSQISMTLNGTDLG